MPIRWRASAVAVVVLLACGLTGCAGPASDPGSGAALAPLTCDEELQTLVRAVVTYHDRVGHYPFDQAAMVQEHVLATTSTHFDVRSGTGRVVLGPKPGRCKLPKVTTTTAPTTTTPPNPAGCHTEARTIRSAAEAYFATHAEYPPSVQVLVDAKLLRGLPRRYELVPGSNVPVVTAIGRAQGCVTETS